MPDILHKKSLSIHSHKTSVALEPEFWQIIEQIVRQRGMSMSQFVTEIDDHRTSSTSKRGLAAHLRLYALRYLRSKTEA